MYEEIFETMVNHLAEIKNWKIEDMKEDALFADDLGGKSLDLAHLATFLEAEFDVDVPYMKFVKQKTLGEMARFVAKAM
ncbi:MAG: acyl carrier protein [Parasporobacterium sp.]|nr:acyl carrier protein [Parasporobacterium sp.]